MSQIKAIETVYKGYRFRSRLEARWAVFFDALGIEWEYEKEGYDLGDAGWYLPDFWLPQVGMWAEVKPMAFAAEEEAKLRALCLLTEHSGLMLDGAPTTRNYWGYQWVGSCEEDDDYQEGLFLDDFVLQEPHYYWKTEGRFFACSGAGGYVVQPITWGHPVGCLCHLCDLGGAVAAARSARFEYGESPRV
jgi:hypothetical protein